MKIVAPIWSTSAMPGDARTPVWPRDLSGKTLGLLHNTKTNGDVALERVAEELTREASGVRIVRVRKPHSSLGISDAEIEELRVCDAVVVAMAD